MKFTADRTALGNALTWVGRAVPANPMAPVTSGIRLELAGDTLTLVGSDYDKAHTTRLPVEGHEDGAVLIPGRLARELVTALPGDTVNIAREDTALTINAGRAKYRVPLMALDEYPSLPSFPTYRGTATAEGLHRVAKTLKYAIDDSRPGFDMIRGVRIEATSDGFLAVGTNRFVIASVTLDWKHEADFDCQVPVAVYETATSGLDGDVEIGYDDGIIGFNDGTRQVTARCVNADYGNWRAGLRFLNDTHQCRVNTGELIDAVKRANLATTGEAPVWFDVHPDHIELTASDATTGDASEVVDADGDVEIRTAFAAKLLVPALAAIPGDTAVLEFSQNPKYPMRVTDPTDDTAFHIVMPRMGKQD